MVVPINVNENHWTAAVISLQKKTIQYYDSLGGNGMQYIKVIYSFLEWEWKRRKLGGGTLEEHKEWKKEWQLLGVSPEEYPKQKNSWDCGVYVCAVYDCLVFPSKTHPANETECFVRRNLVAAAVLVHCLNQKEQDAIDEEAAILAEAKLRQQRKEEEKARKNTSTNGESSEGQTKEQGKDDNEKTTARRDNTTKGKAEAKAPLMIHNRTR